MKTVALALCAVILAWLSTGTGRAGETDTARMSNEALIDALVNVSTSVPGLGDAARFTAFIAGDAPPRFSMGLLGATPPPPAPPAMRELVRRGAAALPALLAHLRDDRRTALSLGASSPGGFGYMWMQYAEEFQPRRGRERWHDTPSLAPPSAGYRVRVGDVCFVLIGQIVNRRMEAVRYQPTAGLVINSPVVMPHLAAAVRRDWAGAGERDLRASLIGDIHRGTRVWAYAGAMERLRAYEPAAYAALAGPDVVKRDAFEAEERRQREEDARPPPGSGS